MRLIPAAAVVVALTLAPLAMAQSGKDAKNKTQLLPYDPQLARLIMLVNRHSVRDKVSSLRLSISSQGKPIAVDVKAKKSHDSDAVRLADTIKQTSFGVDNTYKRKRVQITLVN